MVHRLIRKLFSNDREDKYKGRGPSSKPKDAKVEKLIKLAKARSKKKVAKKKKK